MIHHRQPSTKLFVSLILIVSLLVSSCIFTYRDFPVNMIDNRPAATVTGTLYYQFQREPLFDGRGFKELLAVFRGKTPFSKSEHVAEMPPTGVYCRVITTWRPVSGTAAAFGYISYVFALFLPVLSLGEGHHITYELYIDGQHVKSYDYNVTRKGAVWLGLLPFAWVNFFTYGQDEAFAATAYHFFHQAEPIFQQTITE